MKDRVMKEEEKEKEDKQTKKEKLETPIAATSLLLVYICIHIYKLY